MRQKTRKTITFISFILFPVTMNFFSPYVSIDGAISGVITGSVIVFFIMFLSGIIFGRSWCSYVCPMATLSEISENINSKNPNVKKLTTIRYTIFGVWFSVLVSGFILAGGINGFDPLRLTKNFVSVDMPIKYITYYLVLGLFFILSVALGKRGACHSVCWMSPFLVAGFEVSKLLKIPHLRITSDKSKCISCHRCDKECPMSIEVEKSALRGIISTSNCILCGKCIDVCPKNVLGYAFTKKTK
ncbi:MAG: 4Fe-4S dicluster domain-containing protein [Candidatus Izemoplasmatales bacterium]|nr:4Fe-4S dicluster domain-containing protein [Candidatus Izemoplasmatales bacterium]